MTPRSTQQTSLSTGTGHQHQHHMNNNQREMETVRHQLQPGSVCTDSGFGQITAPPHSHTGNLVSVFSEDVQRRVGNVTASAYSPHVWLGLRHSCVVGLWFWVNGQTLCYEQWAAGYGTGEEDCSTTVRSGAIRTGDRRWVSLPENSAATSKSNPSLPQDMTS